MRLIEEAQRWTGRALHLQQRSDFQCDREEMCDHIDSWAHNKPLQYIL